MRWIVGLAFGATAAVGCHAVAADTEADWLKKPKSEDILAVYPRDAFNRGQSGEVVIHCLVNVQGTLRGCSVLSEKPAGAGFGDAALTMTAQFLMKPGRRDGVPVESEVSIPIHFKMPPEYRPAMASLATRVYSNVSWAAAPTVADIAAAYPEKALAGRISGAATIDCTITKARALAICDILRQDPGGAGFGAAARALAKKFVAPADDGAGRALAGGRTQIQIAFVPPPADGSLPTIGKPRWVSLPSPEAMEGVIKKVRSSPGQTAVRVVLNCDVVAEGKLADCKVESENPAGTGVGGEVLGIVGAARLAVWTEEGLPVVGGRVRVPFRFALKETAAANGTPKP